MTHAYFQRKTEKMICDISDNRLNKLALIHLLKASNICSPEIHGLFHRFRHIMGSVIPHSIQTLLAGPQPILVGNGFLIRDGLKK